MLEDPLVHTYRWLRPDLDPPAPFLSCDPKDTVDGSGVLVEPMLLMSTSGRPGCRSFVAVPEGVLIWMFSGWLLRISHLCSMR